MTKVFLISCLLITCNTFLGSKIYSQSISNQVISSLGENTISTNFSLLSTLGETIYIGGETNTILLTEGFIQPIIDEPLTIESFENFAFKVSPNPVQTFLNIQVPDQIPSNLTMNLYSIEGKLISTQLLTKDDTRIDMSSFSKGTYIIQLIVPKTDTKPKTFKIIKS